MLFVVKLFRNCARRANLTASAHTEAHGHADRRSDSAEAKKNNLMLISCAGCMCSAFALHKDSPMRDKVGPFLTVAYRGEEIVRHMPSVHLTRSMDDSTCSTLQYFFACGA